MSCAGNNFAAAAINCTKKFRLYFSFLFVLTQKETKKSRQTRSLHAFCPASAPGSVLFQPQSNIRYLMISNLNATHFLHTRITNWTVNFTQLMTMAHPRIAVIVRGAFLGYFFLAKKVAIISQADLSIPQRTSTCTIFFNSL